MRASHSGQDGSRQLEPPSDEAPLILTLALDDESQARFDRLRAAHFPPDRNHLHAHVTLFHHLPGRELAPICSELAVVARHHDAFPVQVIGLRPLGRGVAFGLASPALDRLRARLGRTWRPLLGAQDRQGFRPHITVQNKVDPATAAGLLHQLRASFAPFTIRAEGLLLWRYRGGPWAFEAGFGFCGHGAAGQD